MSIEVLNQELDRFLRNPSAGSLAVSGKWGTGKTFWWKSVVEELSKDPPDSHSNYSYVSLFGVSSLDEIRTGIFQNSIPLGGKTSLSDEEEVAKKYRDLSDSFMTGFNFVKKGWSLLGKSDLTKGYFDILDGISFMSVKNKIICLDDIERKSNELGLSEVFGLVSYLRDERNCKVIIILNRDKLGSDLGEYEKYHEKSLDAHLEFNPEFSFCYENSLCSNSMWSPYLLQNSKKLNITNIRILNKISWFSNVLEGQISGIHDELLRQIISSLCLFVYCLQDAGAPKVPFLMERSNNYLVVAQDESKLSDEEISWLELLRDYGFSHVDDLDEFIMRSVQDGYFNNEELKTKVGDVNAQISRQKSRDKFQSAVEMFYSSFEENSDEIGEVIRQAYYAYYPNIHPRLLNQAVNTLRLIGFDGHADELIDHYLDSRDEDRNFYNSSEVFERLQRVDERLKGEFDRRHAEKRVDLTPREILIKIWKDQSRGPEDTEVLVSLSEDQYYSLFHSLRGDELHACVKAALDLADSKGQARTI